MDVGKIRGGRDAFWLCSYEGLFFDIGKTGGGRGVLWLCSYEMFFMYKSGVVKYVIGYVI